MLVRFLAFWVFWFSSTSFGCEWLLRQIGSGVPTPPFTIAVDFDSTMVDTDSFLARVVLPRSVEHVLPLVPASDRGAFEVFLAHLEERGTEGMPLSYEEPDWQKAAWPFPLQYLPSDLVRRPGLEPPLSPLVGFWDVMSEVFDRVPREGIQILPEFERFYRQVNARYGSSVFWIVQTARFEDQIAEIGPTLDALGRPVHEVRVLSRGPKGKISERQAARYKGEQLAQWQQETERPVKLFIDNDTRNLASVRAAMGDSVLLAQMRRHEQGESLLVQWP